jgi:hypothetical protein
VQCAAYGRRAGNQAIVGDLKRLTERAHFAKVSDCKAWRLRHGYGSQQAAGSNRGHRLDGSFHQGLKVRISECHVLLPSSVIRKTQARGYR